MSLITGGPQGTIPGSIDKEDLRRAILTATNISRVERDEHDGDCLKCTIHGRDRFGNPLYTCGKIVHTTVSGIISS